MNEEKVKSKYPHLGSLFPPASLPELIKKQMLFLQACGPISDTQDCVLNVNG